MSNVALVSFKLAPDLYAVLKALAAGEGKSLSALVRETVVEGLDLEGKAERLVVLLGEDA